VKLRCRITKGNVLSKEQLVFFDDVFRLPGRDLSHHLTGGEIYMVYGLEWIDGTPCAYLRSDGAWGPEDPLGYPRFFPLYLFTIEDARLSKYWRYTDRGINSKFGFIGFPEFVEEPHFYESLVDGAPQTVMRFARMVRLLDEEFAEPDE
jgi:hypothetical protein